MSFPRYPAYKGCEVAWIGEIPVHWSMKRVKHVLDHIGSGGTPDTSIEEYWADETGTPWVAIGDMSDREVVQNTSKALTLTGLESKKLTVWPSGTLLFSMYASLGHVAVLCVPAATNQAILALVPLETMHQSFLKRWFEFLRPHLAEQASSNTQDNLNAEKVRNLPVLAPPFPEQTAIATFLDRETAKIDALVAEQEKLIALLQEKRQAVISHAVTKGLDPNVPMKDSGVEWLGEVPGHWVVGGLTRFIGPVIDYRGRTPTKVDEGIFLVTARNIRDGRIDYEASEEFVDPVSAASLLARGKPEIDDLLFTMEAPLGQVALIDRTDIALAQRVVKFRGVPTLMRNSYLLYWLMSTGCQSRLETLATGSTALGIKASKLGMIECLAPPLDEQDSIVALIKHETAKLDTLMTQAQSAITLLQERRTALISAAVTGQIDVRGLAGLANAPDSIAASAYPESA